MKKTVLALSTFFFFILMSMELVAVNGIISKLWFYDATCKGQPYDKYLTNGQTIYLDSFTEFTIYVYCDLSVGTSPRDFALKEPDGTMHYADDKTTEYWAFGPFSEPGTYRGYVDISAIDVTVSPTVAGKVDYVKVDYVEQGVAKSLNMTTANSTIFYFDPGTEYELTIYRQNGVGTTPYLFRVLEIPMGSGVDYKRLSTGSSYYMGGFSAENTTMTAGVDMPYGGNFVSFLPLHASPATYMLTVNLGVGTTGTPSSSQSFASGTSVPYSYSLQAGYQNLVVQLDGTPVPASGSVTMNGPHTLSVSATPISNYLLTVSMGAGTSGSPSSSQAYASGTSVPYSYSLQAGYQSLVVQLDGTPVPASGSVTMNGPHTLSVSATPIGNYLLTVSMGAGTSGSPSSSQSYASGTSVPYSYSLQAGYQSLVVQLDGTPVPASGSVTMNGPHTITVSATGGGCTQQTITCNSTRTGTISASDCQSSPRDSGYYAEKAIFSGAAGQPVTITATWSGMDGYLYLTDGAGTVLDSNDDYNDISQSQIVYTPTSSQTYTIWLTTYYSGSTGSYSLNMTCTANNDRDDLLATWDGQGVYYKDSDSGAWVKLASPATLIANGDLDNDGIDDIIGIWPTQGGVWVKYSSSGNWAQLSSTARHIAAGDMNGDGRVELLGTWDGQGVYWRDNDTGAWTKLASPATLITSGDLDNDGTDDLIGIWPSQGGVWVKYSQTGAWAKLSTTAVDIASGDMNGDGRDELLATWDGQGVYYRTDAGAWVKMASPATQVTAGDLDGDDTDDVIGIWPSQAGVWVKYSQTGSWALLGSTARDIGAGRMRAAGLAGAECWIQAPGRSEGDCGPDALAGGLDLSEYGPGGMNFHCLEAENMEPCAPRDAVFVPGPGEPGFTCAEQANLEPRLTKNVKRESDPAMQ